MKQTLNQFSKKGRYDMNSRTIKTGTIVAASIAVLTASAFFGLYYSMCNATASLTYLCPPITSIGGISASWISQTGVVYAGVPGPNNGSIYSSSDGITWSAPMLNIADANGCRSIFVNAKGYIFASSLSNSSAGIWRSINNGENWTEVLALNASQRIWGMDSDTGGNIFAGLYATQAGAVIWKSIDDGATWNIVYNDQQANHVHQIAVDKVTNYIYASVGDNVTPFYSYYVIRSTDDGLTWNKILAGMPQVVGIAAGNGYRVFGSDTGDNGAIYRTTDDISYSTVFQFSGNVQNFWIRSDNSSTLFASFVAQKMLKAEILISVDNGTTWQHFWGLNASVPYDGSQYCSNFVNGIAYFSNNDGLYHAYKIYSRDYYHGGWCLNFSGTNAPYVSLSYAGNSASLTIEAWVKPAYDITPGSNSTYGHRWGTVAHRDTVGGDASGDGGWWFGFDYLNGVLDFRLFQGYATTPVFNANNHLWNSSSWYYIAVTYDAYASSGNVKFYVNGTLDSQRDGQYNIYYYTNPQHPLEVGAMSDNTNGNSAYAGLIDELRVWNVPRNQTEIQSAWNRILNDTETANSYLVGYWRFDDGSGKYAADYSSYEYVGTLLPNEFQPQWVTPGAPITPEFSSISMMFGLVAISSISAIPLRRRLKKLGPPRLRE
jgi:hypothetical protein